MRIGVVATSVVAACQFSAGRLPSDGNTDAASPDAGMCASLESECVGDSLRVCTALGVPPTDFPCGWGCLSGQTPHCAHVIPSGSGGVDGNGVRASDVAPDGLSDVTLPDGIIFDGDFGRVGTLGNANLFHGPQPGIENGVDFQNRGPISMFRFKSLRIAGGVSLIGKRPIAIVADGAITINGLINAQNACTQSSAGPGGYDGGSASGQDGSQPAGTMGGGSGAPASSGGGGAGHGTAGGSGAAAKGGMPYGDLAITTLVGGAGGGAGGGGANFGRGGGGGGALQLVSNTRIVITAGGINASGCGGNAGTGANDSGGGGGAGGTILIEAPSVDIAGTLAANGGGGGGGGGNKSTPGGNGTLGRTPATAGQGDGNDEQGGTGGAGSTAPMAGGSGSNPGGGGGAVGRIRINTRSGTGAALTNATLSPGPNDPSTTFSTGTAVAQ